MELIISTVVCIALLIVLNICAKKGMRLPAKFLIHLVLLGLAVAAVITLLSVFVSDWDSMLLTGLLKLNSTNFLYMLIDNFILTALMEEGLKYLFVRLYLRKKDRIKCKYQGIVAVSAVAAGFVVAENIIYILGDSGLILRITFGLFGHFVYAVFMGTDISRAMMTSDASMKRKLYLRALFLPTLLHGAYDLALSVLELDMDPFLYILLLLHIVGAFVFFYVIATIKKIRGAVREMKSISVETSAQEIGGI